MRDSTISFVNSDGLDSWRFDTRPGSDIGSIYVQSSSQHTIWTRYRHHKYRIPYHVASFKEGDNLRVELAYAVPKYQCVCLGCGQRTIVYGKWRVCV